MRRRRRLLGLAWLSALAVASSVLLLTDRAPVLYRRGVDRAFDWAGDVLDRLGVDAPSRSRIPIGAYAGAHLALFFTATLVAGYVLRGRVRPAVVAVAVFAASAAFELAQPLLSRSRDQQLDDLIANGVGVLAGYLVLAVVLPITAKRRPRSLAR